MWIVFIDDEPQIRRAVERAVLSRGHRVDTFEDGDKALSFLRAQTSSPDYVIADGKMPILDGRGLYEALVRELPELVEHFIMFTADREHEDYCEQHNIVCFIKPVDVVSLLDGLGL